MDWQLPFRGLESSSSTTFRAAGRVLMSPTVPRFGRGTVGVPVHEPECGSRDHHHAVSRHDLAGPHEWEIR